MTRLAQIRARIAEERARITSAQSAAGATRLVAAVDRAWLADRVKALAHACRLAAHDFDDLFDRDAVPDGMEAGLHITRGYITRALAALEEPADG